MVFRIAQISDTHLSEEKPFFIENFRRIGAALRASSPDLVVNSGDISLDGADDETDLAAARALHDALDLPIRYLPGNHDLGDSQDAPAHGEGAIDLDRRERYLRHFDMDFWSFDVPGWRVLGINAQLLGSDLAEAAAEQESLVYWAASTLEARRLALFLHKPLFDRDCRETAVTGRFVNPVPRRRLLELLAKAPPALVACGHVHQYRELQADGASHVWATSTAFVIPDARQPRYGVKEVGYVEHQLGEDGTFASRFVQVPGVPTLNIADFPGAYGPL